MSVSKVSVNAAKGTVWKVVTEPVHVRQWQYGSVLDTDWSIGGSIRFTTEWDGQTFEQWGTVLSVDAPNKLSYSLFAPRPDLEDRDENYFTMTYELTDDHGVTVLTITQEDPRPSDGPDDDESEDENPVLIALKGVAESLEYDDQN
ncbi:MAG TPA: SRPBCC family protein [Acidimicrobiales bacterium]